MVVLMAVELVVKKAALLDTQSAVSMVAGSVSTSVDL